MTTYDYAESSINVSRPVELYVFSVAGQTYRYTSREIPIVYGGNTYTPAILVRNDITIPTLQDTPELVLQIPTPDDMINSYGFGPPPQSFTCTVYRYQITSAVAIIIWQGRVGGIAVERTHAKVRIPSLLGDALDTTVPSRRFGELCSHVLYDEGCTLSSADFAHPTTVSGVNGTVLAVATVGSSATNYYKNGRVTRGLDGEHRQIIAYLGATSFRLDYPFREMANGNAITLYAGCDKLVTTCRSKFSNVPNFGGHPDIPVRNPYASGKRWWEMN